MIPNPQVERWKKLVQASSIGLMADLMLLCLEEMEKQTDQPRKIDWDVVVKAHSRVMELVAGHGYYMRAMYEHEMYGGESARLVDDYLFFAEAVRDIPSNGPSDCLASMERGLRFMLSGLMLSADTIWQQERERLRTIFTALSDYATAEHNRLSVPMAVAVAGRQDRVSLDMGGLEDTVSHEGDEGVQPME